MSRDLRGARTLLHGDAPLRSAVTAALEAAGVRLVDDAGALDALVVLATPPGKEDLDSVLERGFLAPVRVIRAALPALEASAGRLVAVVDRADSREPRAGAAPAAAAAHGLRGLVTTLHTELAAGRRGARAHLLELDLSDPDVVAAAVVDALR